MEDWRCMLAALGASSRCCCVVGLVSHELQVLLIGEPILDSSHQLQHFRSAFYAPEGRLELIDQHLSS